MIICSAAPLHTLRYTCAPRHGLTAPCSVRPCSCALLCCAACSMPLFDSFTATRNPPPTPTAMPWSSPLAAATPRVHAPHIATSHLRVSTLHVPCRCTADLHLPAHATGSPPLP